METPLLHLDQVVRQRSDTQPHTSISVFVDVVILVLRRRGRGGVGRVGEGVRRKLRRLENEEDAAAAAGPERAAGWPGEEGDAEEGGEAREEVERRAADQREDAVGRERLRVARHPLPRRRRPAL